MTTTDPRAQSLIAHFEAQDYARATPAILQPAEPFLDLSGEDIRRRMYLTTDAAGREFCLRPDLTIPVARDYLGSPAAGSVANLCYLGPVFRYRGAAAAEFIQGGVESFGRHDIAAADAEMVALALEAAQHYGIASPDIRMGDVGLFAALIEAIDLPAAWKRRLVKDFNRAETLKHDLASLNVEAEQRAEYQGVLAALAGQDRKGAQALIRDLISIAGITAVGGRSIDEIAERFLDQAALTSAARLSQETTAVIQRFLAISADPDTAAAALRTLGADAGLDMEQALDLFESRTGFLAARGLDVSRIAFSTGYGRGLDYYTGLVFELHPASGDGRPLVAGGRYDGMLARLGAKEPIPAVGFAVWPDRLADAGAGGVA